MASLFFFEGNRVALQIDDLLQAFVVDGSRRQQRGNEGISHRNHFRTNGRRNLRPKKYTVGLHFSDIFEMRRDALGGIVGTADHEGYFLTFPKKVPCFLRNRETQPLTNS
jgi:hypothetical protein